VSRIRGSREILLMAAVASRWQRCVIVIRVAASARNSGVCTRQRERSRIVIETRPCPVSGRVTGRAGGGEAGRDVRRIVGSRVSGLVA